MCDIKKIYIGDFQKCGEIMVASRRNELALSCNFCQLMFSQLQSFMIHLQLQHNDKLEFVGPDKTVEEELMNQTLSPGVPDAGSEESISIEDTNWLDAEDMKWLDKGVEPKKCRHLEKESDATRCEDKNDSFKMASSPILKVLQDCDVSFNLMDNNHGTLCSEDKIKASIDNTLLREIHNDWEDSNSNESNSSKIYFTDMEIINCSKDLMKFRAALDANVTKPDHFLGNSYVGETINITKTKFDECTETYLQDPDNLDYVDSLLEHLEYNQPTSKNSNSTLKTCEGGISRHTNFIQNHNLSTGRYLGKTFLLNPTLDINLSDFNENKSKNKTKSENVLDMESTRTLEDDLNERVIFSNNIASSTDFEMLSKNLKEIVNETETTILPKRSTQSGSDILLREDLVRALADAFDFEDLDLIHKQKPEESEEPLNENILKLLQRAMKEKENDKELSPLQKQHTLHASALIKKHEQNETINNQQTSININKSTVKMKYQKENIKACTKKSEIQNMHSKNSVVLKESNLSNSDRVLKNMPNNAIFLNQKQKTSINNSLNCSAKNPALDYKSYTINNSTQNKEVLQRMRHIKKHILKSIEEGEYATKVNNIKHPDRPQVIPNFKGKMLHLNILNKPYEKIPSSTTTKFEIPLAHFANDHQQGEISFVVDQNSLVNNNENLMKNSIKRPASSTLVNENKQAKRQHKSSAKEQNKALREPSELETTQFYLSENAVDFLQSDLRVNRKYVESLLKEELPEDVPSDKTFIESSDRNTQITNKTFDEGLNCSNLINVLLEQVNNEQTLKEKTINENVSSKNAAVSVTNTVKDFDDCKDIKLLEKVGLKIIKLPKIEDNISLEERVEMYEKASKFATIFKNWPTIWSTKNSRSFTLQEELKTSFKELLIEINLSFKLGLGIVELKRITNLIHFWYINNFNSKLIEKRKICESTNRYLLLFNYIPKTIKRFYFCKYCEEYFNTEHRYFNHRIIHTGALYPYKCQKCLLGFKSVRLLRNHEPACIAIVNNNNYKEKSQNEK